MKKFITTTFALTLFSTASVFGASYSPNNQTLNFLTINGKPISYNQNNSQSKPNNNVNDNQNNSNNNLNCKPNKPNNNTNNNTNNKPLPEKPNQSVEDDNNLNSSVSNVEQEVVRLVNIERQKAGLAPLKMDTQLSKVARLKSEDMKKKGYFSHTSPTYGSPFDMLKQFNITYKTAGENIAKGQRTAQQVVDAWMNSEGHRRNILSKSFTHIGVGNTSNYWTQLFIAK
ncbi:CAP domain-containing protein [[Clostridium] colinum]|uniref:CAP domain-containing protein n=1 Tax=[Clostridium] colinum TaxID=36835 RepID=UPI0020258C69|nr:CAP domain-containing protein [[Clostridium] colinum]